MKLQELAEMAQQDNKKLEELKHTQAELEKLLQEETQAKRDEEIVRALQARYLQFYKNIEKSKKLKSKL